MGIYYCESCDKPKDNDYVIQEVSGYCTPCHNSLMEEGSEEAVKARVYEIEQRATNRSMKESGDGSA